MHLVTRGDNTIRNQSPRKLWLRILAAALLAISTARASDTLTTLVVFNGSNGAFPSAPLLQGTNGDFYGTTAAGGPNLSRGTIFEMKPSGQMTNLLSLTPPYAYGADPYAGLVQARDGNFYGAGSAGGAYSQGAVFKVTPAGSPAVLYSFSGSFDGAQPQAALLEAGDGNFYGTTTWAGDYSEGTVFQLTPSGTLNVLYSFSDGDGVNPCARLAQGGDGSFYGTTKYGGAGFNGTNFSGDGTVFKITTNGVLTTINAFTGDDGAHPATGLAQGPDGNFYGTTYQGGTGGSNGTVFKISASGYLTTLASFNGANGALPAGDLVAGAGGNLYGTTSAGGIGYDGTAGSGYGTVFRITTNGVLTTLILFNDLNGSAPLAGLVQGLDGSFYGTTSTGGSYHAGTVFRLSLVSPPPPALRLLGHTAATTSLGWTAAAGQNYQMQYKNSLGQTNWNNLGSVVVATNAAATFSDTTATNAQRFYRVALAP
jgi:uncharacterized repeat protein (TIGR03803 family)